MITLKTLPQATEQEVFDQIAAHLLKQGKQSGDMNTYTGRFDCSYRNAEGLSCAAGCLIGADEYHKLMEGASWESLTVSKTVPVAHVGLIQELQMVHDFNDPNHWAEILKKVAFNYRLTFNYGRIPSNDHT